jgi:hypothetical protein
VNPSFHEIQLPANYNWEPKLGPGYKTKLGELESGHEEREEDWPHQRGEFDVAYTLQTDVQLRKLLTFYYCRYSMGYGFRFKDWSDYQAINAPLGGGPTWESTFGLAVNTGIASIQRRFRKATVTTTAASSNLSVRQYFQIRGCPDASFNGRYRVLEVLGANTFTFTSIGNDTGVVTGGTVTGNPYQMGKLYKDAGGSKFRTINKPCDGTFTDATGYTPAPPIVYVDGVPQTLDGGALDNDGPIATAVVHVPSGTQPINYMVGDTGKLISGGSSGTAQYVITAVDNNGAPLTASISDPGDAYTAGTVYSTSVLTGNGNGFFQMQVLSIVPFPATSNRGPAKTWSVWSGGTDYAIGDTGTIPGASGDATYVVDDVDPLTGAVTAFTLDNLGTLYGPAPQQYATTSTTGIGTGFYAYITTISRILTEVYRLDVTTGLVTFDMNEGNGPAHGAVLTADCDFDVPTRFDTDQVEMTLQEFNNGQWSVKVVEINQLEGASSTITLAPPQPIGVGGVPGANAIVLASVAYSPTAIAGNGSSVCTITLSGPAPVGGALVTLSGNPNLATNPDTLLIPEGQTSGAFTAVGVSAGAGTLHLTLTATYNNSTKTATLQLNAF